MRVNLSCLLSLALLTAANPLVSRGLEKCKTLSAKSNDGGRKIAIVIDESGSMASSDPYDLRIQAGKAVNDWLISSSEAKGGKSADLVTVIGFDDSARLLYPLGDPSGADKAIDQITILGGTSIYAGVDQAISQLTLSGHDPTKDRSGIVVLSDGSDYSTPTLVKSIENAGQLGIRLSFGFLTTYGFTYQDPKVLSAILGTGGMYATIDGSGAQNAFVNLMIVHGLTAKDNPSPEKSTTVYNGLSVAFVLGSDGNSALTYTAQAGEGLTFMISSITAGALNVTAVDSSGKEIGKTTVSRSSSTPQRLQVKASSSGNLQIKVQGQPRLTDAMFVVGVNSSIPLVNCTLGDIGDKGGLSTGAKAGIGIGVPLLLGMVGAGSFYAWKYWKGGFPGGSPPSAPTQPPMNDYKQPYTNTTELPTPSPQPPGGSHPGWMMPPPKLPNAPKAPNQPNSSDKPDQYNYDQPHAPNNSQPYNPNGSDLPQNSNNNSQPFSPNGNDMPQNLNNGQPCNPSGNDVPHNPNGSDMPQTHNGGDMPQTHNGGDMPQTHNGGDMPQSHNGGDMPQSHNGGDMPQSHNGGDMPQTHNGGDMPQSPNNGQPDSPPTQSDPAPPNNPPQGDPNQPGQNPNNPHNPQDPHPKRLPTPRLPLRLFGRRRKKDDENQNQNQNQAQGQYQSQSAQQSYNHTVGYPQPVYSTEGTVIRPPLPQHNVQHELHSVTAPRPNHSELDGQLQTQQYSGFTQQYSYGPPVNQPQQHYGHSPSPSNFSFPRPYPGSPNQGSVSPPRQYASPAVAPQSEGQNVTFNSTPLPAQQPRNAYNVSPILRPAERSQNVQSYSLDDQPEHIGPADTKQGSISRKPVGGH